MTPLDLIRLVMISFGFISSSRSSTVGTAWRNLESASKIRDRLGNDPDIGRFRLGNGGTLRGTSALSTTLELPRIATWGRHSSKPAPDGYLQRPCGLWTPLQVPHGLAGVVSPITHLSDNSPCSLTSRQSSRLDPERQLTLISTRHLTIHPLILLVSCTMAGVTTRDSSWN
jgi:hypothetical protein